MCREVKRFSTQQNFSKSFLHKSERFKNDNESPQNATEREKIKKNIFTNYIKQMTNIMTYNLNETLQVNYIWYESNILPVF